MGGDNHWVEWHRQYDTDESSLSRRLKVVQRRLSEALDSAPQGELGLLSMCSGQGRDVIEVLAGHPRKQDVSASLVELDPSLAEHARREARLSDLEKVKVVEGDASLTDEYAAVAPVDIALVCGVFGNITNEDIESTVYELRHLCAEGATVIWTRHRRPPDVTPKIRRWLEEAGFEGVAFDSGEPYLFGVGTARFVGPAMPFRPGRRMFTFTGDGFAAHL
jgi:hypothetical protein